MSIHFRDCFRQTRGSGLVVPSFMMVGVLVIDLSDPLRPAGIMLTFGGRFPK